MIEEVDGVERVSVDVDAKRSTPPSAWPRWAAI
jgi:hypothetical protein